MSSTGKNPTEAEVKSWAEDAFSRIKLAGLSPTPEMFALFYYGTAKPTSSFAQAIIKLENDADAMDRPTLLGLMRQMPWVEDDDSDAAMEAAVETLTGALEQVLTLMAEAGIDTGHYLTTLNTFSQKAGEAKSQQQLSTLVDTLVEQTNIMIHSQSRLEASLQQSVAEVETLQNEVIRLREVNLQDDVTGLANERALDRLLKRVIRTGTRNKGAMSATRVSVEGYDDLAQQHGLRLANQVLKLVANEINRVVHDECRAVRYQSAQFVLLQPGVATDVAKVQAREMISKLARKELRRRGTGQSFGYIIANAGVVAIDPADDADALLERLRVAAV